MTTRAWCPTHGWYALTARGNGRYDWCCEASRTRRGVGPAPTYIGGTLISTTADSVEFVEPREPTKDERKS
ncbi:MAG: hypothetical protein ACREJC_18960 [Tepidisphaeraceae bacterium]